MGRTSLLLKPGVQQFLRKFCQKQIRALRFPFAQNVRSVGEARRALLETCCNSINPEKNISSAIRREQKEVEASYSGGVLDQRETITAVNQNL
ncbi:hypothetical protein RB195_009379 [Necator americanus]|uniref:Uncharacterized protein n=1 Tax=Necator americanus TaxID=51031 RepID=A0ABR1CT26_NECAM